MLVGRLSGRLLPCWAAVLLPLSYCLVRCLRSLGVAWLAVGQVSKPEKIEYPPWYPTLGPGFTGLMVHNSLTDSLVPFVPVRRPIHCGGPSTAPLRLYRQRSRELLLHPT